MAVEPGHQVQLTLALPFDEAMSRDDFIVSDANQQAFAFISAWPEWAANVAVLIGPPGSGKTHLANIWALESGAQVHRAKNVTIDSIPDWLATGALVLENVHVSGLDEEALFHLVNEVRGGNGFLLMTADDPVQNWPITILDLMSRLRAAVPVEILPPDDVLMRQIFVKQFLDRQITIEPSVVDYLVSRMERSLNAVREAVTKLDQMALSEGRRITKRLAADALNL